MCKWALFSEGLNPTSHGSVPKSMVSPIDCCIDSQQYGHANPFEVAVLPDYIILNIGVSLFCPLLFNKLNVRRKETSYSHVFNHIFNCNRSSLTQCTELSMFFCCPTNRIYELGTKVLFYIRSSRKYVPSPLFGSNSCNFYALKRWFRFARI